MIAIGAFIFVLGRDFANENEIEYIINQILNGSLEAVVLVLTYIILIIINVRNIKIMFKK